MRANLIAIVACFTCMVSSNFAICSEDGPRGWAPKGLANLPAEVVRSAILEILNAESELGAVISPAEHERTLPFWYDIFIPGDWPNFSEISSAPDRPFVKFGDWRVGFGNERLVFGSDADRDPCILRRLVNTVVLRYRRDGGETYIDCVEVLLEVDSDDYVRQNKAGGIQKLRYSGWQVTEFTMKDHGTFARAPKWKCVAAGGSLRARAGREFETPITRTAFVGHVERYLGR